MSCIGESAPIGIYIHIPFCERKCNYCNFYSAFYGEDMLNSYVFALNREIKNQGGRINRPVGTVYFGGGTPSLLGDRLPLVMNTVRECFNLTDDAEITLEMNPKNDCGELLKSAAEAGVNRLSIGAQSGIDSELKRLGRRHTAFDTIKAVETARRAGIDNISLDIMTGLPDSTLETLEKSLDFLLVLEPRHISSYILKIEPNTAFYKNADNLNLPDDDAAAEQYLFLCRYLEENGYDHYEISNFCKKNSESRHNLKYWNDEEYLGVGPSAHSYLNGKRFYYPNSIKDFINGAETVPDADGGSREEYIMLRLRLKKGLVFSAYEEKYGDIPNEFFDICRLLQKAGYMTADKEHIALTDKGMAVSNSVITELICTL